MPPYNYDVPPWSLRLTLEGKEPVLFERYCPEVTDTKYLDELQELAEYVATMRPSVIEKLKIARYYCGEFYRFEDTFACTPEALTDDVPL